MLLRIAGATVLAAAAILFLACAGSSPAPSSPADPAPGGSSTTVADPASSATATPDDADLSADQPTVYFIHTSWCSNCKAIRPTWSEIEAEYGDRIHLIEVDRDSRDGRAFAESHNIYYQPGFVVLDPSGAVTYAGLGPFRPDEVRALVSEAAGD